MIILEHIVTGYFFLMVIVVGIFLLTVNTPDDDELDQESRQ